MRRVTSASTRDPFFFGPSPVRQLPHVRAPRSGCRARRLSRPPHPSRVCSGRRRPPVHAARRGRARLPPRRPSRLGVAVPVRLVVSIPAASRGLIPAARRGSSLLPSSSPSVRPCSALPLGPSVADCPPVLLRLLSHCPVLLLLYFARCLLLLLSIV